MALKFLSMPIKIEVNTVRSDIFDTTPKHKPTHSCKDRRNRILLFLALLKEKQTRFDIARQNDSSIDSTSVTYVSFGEIEHIIDELIALDI